MEQLLQLDWLGSPLLVGILYFVVTVGAIVQFGVGMGFGVVASPIMALIEPKLVPVPSLYIGFFTSLGAAYSARDTISWPEVKLFATGRLIGSLFALGALYISGWAGWDETMYTLLLLPPVITGMVIGKRLKGRLDHRFRSILLTLSALASITLIIRGLT